MTTNLCICECVCVRGQYSYDSITFAYLLQGYHKEIRKKLDEITEPKARDRDKAKDSGHQERQTEIELDDEIEEQRKRERER